MKKLSFLVVAGALAMSSLPAIAQESAAPAVTVEAGKMLYADGGKRLAAIYRVADDGSPQLILDGKLVTVPIATVSVVDGQFQTSLSKKDIRKLN